MLTQGANSIFVDKVGLRFPTFSSKSLQTAA
jgi:hypothetical protein